MAQLVNVLPLWKNTTFLSFSPHKYTELKITTQDHFLHIISYTLVPNKQVSGASSGKWKRRARADTGGHGRGRGLGFGHGLHQ